MKDCARGLWFTFGGWWWLKQVPYQHHIWEFGWIFNIFFWFWLLTRACRKAANRTATLFLRGKMGKGRRAPIPACIGNKTHGTFIHSTSLTSFQTNSNIIILLIYFLIPSSSVAKIRELYPEEDGQYMGYKRKKRIRKSPKSVKQ